MDNKQTSPYFSVIIPIYNVEKYVSEAVESVLNQSFSDFELILVDDGSQDSCSEICDKYALLDNRVVVIHKDNAGLVEARKSGVRIAKGIYSLCLDGDDWLDTSTLSKVFEKIEAFNCPDVVSFRLIETDGLTEKENVIYNTSGFYSRIDIEKYIFPMLIQKENATYFAPSICGKAIKSGIYRKCQEMVNRNVLIGEDGACTIPCVYYSQSLYIMEEYLYYYRTNLNSVTKSRKALSMDLPKFYAESIKKAINVKEYDFEEQLYRKIVHDLFFVIVSQFSRSESYGKIRRDIISKLKEPYYAEAVRKAKFSHSKKAMLMMFSLRHKLICLFKIYYFMR